MADENTTPTLPAQEFWSGHCRKCGIDGDTDDAFIISDRDVAPPHYKKVICGFCGSWLDWVKKPGTVKLRPKNDAWRWDWVTRHSGDLRCAMCAVAESETASHFAIHHAWRREDGGPDELWNTIPLCNDCHEIAERLRALRLHVLGRSARNTPTTAA